MYQGIGGAVLGASTIAGIAILPYTGDNKKLFMILPIAGFMSGILVLSSFVATRVIKKIIK